MGFSKERTKTEVDAHVVQEIIEQKEQIQSLDRKIKENKKSVQQIEQSNTWKVVKMIKKITHTFGRFFCGKNIKQQMEVEQLNKKLFETESELFALREQVSELQLLDNNLNTNEIHQLIREMKNDGELIQYINRLVDDKKCRQKNYKEALTYIARLYMNEDEQTKNILYTKILEGLTIEEIPEFMIREGLTGKPIPLMQASSFRGSLNMRMRQKQLHDTLPEWRLDDKRTAYNFIGRLGINKPDADENHYTVETIPKKEGIVIKPADGAGSRGVYLIHQLDDIFDVKRSVQLNSWNELLESMQQDLITNAVDKDNWMIEQLVYENRVERTPARDVKFYCFYGKIGIVLEIIRDPEVRQCWWTSTGQRISTGKYDDSLFHGIGVTEEELEMVQQLSAKIPAPFIRIDFLRDENGLVFGEFTPKPGNYDEFDNVTDAWLGDYFLKAEGKLVYDLLNGKKFNEFNEYIDEMEETNVL